MQAQFQEAINEMLKSIKYLIGQSFKKTTKCYDAIIIESNADGTWQVKFNGEVHTLKPYGSISPSVGKMVKVIVPQGNMSIAFFF